MADTGGGHRSAGQALAEAFAEEDPLAQVVMVDALRHHAPFPVNHIHRTYRPLIHHGRWLWSAAWHLSRGYSRVERMRRVFWPVARRRLAALYRSQEPDLVVSVHPLLNHVPLDVVRQALPGVPFATVVTDLVSVHPAWLCPDVDLLCVPTEAAGRLALSAGVPRERVRVSGLPVSRKFSPAMNGNGAEITDNQPGRRRLGLHPDLPLVLLVSGGEGMGPVSDIARALAQTIQRGGHSAGQLAIICGRNHALQRRLEAMHWGIPVRVAGFVENMPEWMAAADLVVTKAGPGTISEALIMGLPILLSGFIPGQEEGNVPYVVDNGAGAYESQPERLAARAAEWLRPGNPALAQMAARARALAKPNAARDIARDLLALLASSP
ncbi:MAG: glycosyltransferase [Anaerolineae bacterium]|nr:glycosyltransferase [Anaerolineae bacterium]